MKLPAFVVPSAFLLVVAGVTLILAPPVSAQPADTLQLDEAIQMALRQNPGVHIADREAAVAANDHALGNAGFLPRLSLQAQQNRQPGGSFGGGALPGEGGGQRFGTFNSSVSASWTVFDGMRRFALYDQLEARRNEAVVQAENVEENVVADVVTRYYAVARQQQQIEVLTEAVELSDERLQIAELRRDLGSASDLDVRQARIDLNEDRAALLEQESALSTARTQLNRVLGRSAPVVFQVSEETQMTAEFDLEQLTREALQHNRALRAARNAQTEAGLQRRVVQSERLPRIDVTAGYGFNDLAADVGMPTVQPGGFSYGITATLDVFEGFNRQRRMENADLQVQRQDYVIAELETDVQAFLQEAMQAYENSRRRAELEYENLEAARQNVDVALERFRLGTITSVELRELQRTLTRIESRLLAAHYEAKEAETALLQLSGRLLGRWR